MQDPRQILAAQMTQRPPQQQPAMVVQQPAYAGMQPPPQQAGGGGGLPPGATTAMSHYMAGGAGGGSAPAGFTGAGLHAAAPAAGTGFTGAGVHAGAGAGGATGGGAGGMGAGLAAAGPWAALAAAVIGNETYAKKHGYRREGSDYWKDLGTGNVFWQDIENRWGPKIFGNSTLGADSRGVSQMMQGNVSEGWDTMKEEGPLKYAFKLFD